MLRLIVLSVLMLGCAPAFAQEEEPTPVDDVIRTESTTNSTVTTNGKIENEIKSPPPSAISPTINTSNSDLCTFGVAGAVQTQILGISMGSQVTDETCEMLKLSKTLYDMGMKVAAVSTMCQDRRVFEAMMNAGTPCPYDGMIGEDAKLAWMAEDEVDLPDGSTKEDEAWVNEENTVWWGGLVAALASYSSSSYSEIVFGQTSNAADFGYNWVMRNVLPQQAGLEVTGVIYRYVAVKDPESDMIVYVQNEDAQNEGEYIFREADDWSGRPGNSIFKLVPTENILIDRWGDGSIEVEGEGSVEDATVVYNYRFDPCFDPQSDPSCPDYVPPIPDIPEVDLSMYDDMNAQFVQDDEDSKKMKMSDEEQERERSSQCIGTKRRESN